MSATPQIRIARPTDDLDALIPFYRDGLDLELLHRFEDHQGFDGIILGRPGVPYHLEFTSTKRHAAGRAPTQDHILVFYVPDPAEWRGSVARMIAVGFPPVPSFNPYWDVKGLTFQDANGYRVVLQQGDWIG